MAEGTASHRRLASVLVRESRESDIPSCLEIQRSEGNPLFSFQDFGTMVRDPDCIFQVFELKGRVVGFIAGFLVPTKRSEAIIHATMVHRDFRHRGIGKFLVESFAVTAFDKHGVGAILAQVESGPDAFYGKCRFGKEAVWNSMVLRRESFMTGGPPP
ncbi:MAG TPA: GNAT family N-acetyltransferase [Thermoplasmata archaeon]|nr:GNAT family N-acetyltransferase [Thermoplasmata archaeon]